MQISIEVFKSCIFWVGNFVARYFFGSKISGLCIFLDLQYVAPLDPPPPVMYTLSTPLGVARGVNSRVPFPRWGIRPEMSWLHFSLFNNFPVNESYV